MANAGYSLVSKIWFPQNERTFSTSIAYGANGLGNAFAFLIPSLIINCGSDTEKGFKECVN